MDGVTVVQWNRVLSCNRTRLKGEVAVVSLAIVSMYTNMSEELATNACKDYISSRTYHLYGNDNFGSKNSLLSAVDLCLKNSIFQFNNKIYKQINGVDTGVKLAPSYACLGFGKFEKKN